MRSRTTLTGTSGATVYVGTRAALKQDKKNPGLMLRQAMFMRGSAAYFPRVLRIWAAEGAYAMQRLEDAACLAEPDPLRRLDLLRLMALSMYRERMKHTPLPASSYSWPEEHDAVYLYRLSAHVPPHIQRKVFFNLVEDMLLVANFKRLRRVPIHGDLTLDNLMIDQEEQFYLIDPLPAFGPIPPLLAVDMGKLLQSARGYEWVKYRGAVGVPVPRQSDAAQQVLQGLSSEERFAAEYFYRIHVLRLLPYASSHVVSFYRKEVLPCFLHSISTTL